MITDQSIAAIKAQFLDGRTGSSRPVLYCMAGIPGSGKTTFVDNSIARGIFPANSFLLDPDRVMQALPEYHRDFDLHGPETAFSRWEMPARNLAYTMLDEAATRRLDIIKDMGCARMENYEMLKRLKHHGYRLMMFHLHCEVNEALRRISVRARHTPETMIRERAEALQDLMPLYQDLADHFVTIDNSSPVTLDTLAA